MGKFLVGETMVSHTGEGHIVEDEDTLQLQKETAVVIIDMI